jgi:hypothetical protein
MTLIAQQNRILHVLKQIFARLNIHTVGYSILYRILLTFSFKFKPFLKSNKRNRSERVGYDLQLRNCFLRSKNKRGNRSVRVGYDLHNRNCFLDMCQLFFFSQYNCLLCAEALPTVSSVIVL